MVEEKRSEINLAETEKSLFIKAYCWSQHHTSSVIIENSHDEITEINVDGEIILKNNSDEHLNVNNCSDEHPNLNIHTIFEFATESPIEELTFILESAKLNHAIAKEGLHKRYGLSVGKTLKDLRYQNVFGDGIISYAMALTASAVDARMAGCTLPAMSNSGSGNQGITITLPVLAVFNKLKSDEEDFIRALIISHLVAIHIKSYLGRLSALCGCVVASTGAACGITYLMGGGYEELTYAIKNMIGNITGMVCDGAKSGCALKVSSGTSSAVQSAILAVDKICISDNDGIIENDIETTISNLGKIGSKGMKYTDNIMLNIMINKSGNNKECI